MSLILAGSITFLLLGIEPRTSYKKKFSEKNLRKALEITVGGLIITAALGYLALQEYQSSNQETQIQNIAEENFDVILHEEIDFQDSTQNIELVVVGTENQEKNFRTQLEELSTGG